MAELTHFDSQGAARMVDVSGKAETDREAIAEGRVFMLPETLGLILDRNISKGDVFSVARVAGIMAAKKTADVIPLCHQLALTSVEVSFEPIERRHARILARSEQRENRRGDGSVDSRGRGGLTTRYVQGSGPGHDDHRCSPQKKTGGKSGILKKRG
jgi:molybdenum cofactor biosynthesis protein MoaC